MSKSVGLGYPLHRSSPPSPMSMSVLTFSFKKESKRIPLVIDASAESGRLGRLVSHANGTDEKQNCYPQVTVLDGKPRLFLRASRDIVQGEELAYDYADRRRDVIKDNPWLGNSKEA